MPAVKKKGKLWKCPRCRRYFPKQGQQHACNSFPVAGHFEGKPKTVKRIFETLKKRVASMGRVKVGSVRTEIFFQNRFHFAACQVKPRHLILVFPLARRLASARFKNLCQVGRGKFLYSVRLASLGDVDGELASLLREAHRNAS